MSAASRPGDKGTLYTIGHSNHPIEQFIDLLQRHCVEAVADVRSIPASRRHPHFNRNALSAVLAAHGIGYLFLGEELGARRTEPDAYDGNVASYELVARLPAFQQGLDQVRKEVPKRRIALLCAEKDPLDCHRALLVCRHLRSDLPGRIQHILADGALRPHTELEQRLVAGMGINLDQKEMFGGEAEHRLEDAYRRRGREIAHKRPV